jgi:hypothetical protein
MDADFGPQNWIEYSMAASVTKCCGGRLMKQQAPKKSSIPRPEGVKIVPAPTNPKLREWAEGPDITIDGGYHSMRKSKKSTPESSKS